ncbi:hypothetical protein Tco_0857457 [Tanacetum coccineum]|uniref:Reverse transcriptase domain-containing protein n=1 Tax=Tanacetum coccineum TaxID=301880 RepID=A0ABQ5B6G0_9ASTR
MPVELGSFDAIISTDWLAKYQAIIVCAEKIVRIPWRNKTLIIHGDGSNQGNVTRLNIIHRIKRKKYMEKVKNRYPNSSELIDFFVQLQGVECLLKIEPKVQVITTEGSRRRHSKDCLQNSLRPLGNFKMLPFVGSNAPVRILDL